jgi:multiple sugar transport system substrate-binding protein
MKGANRVILFLIFTAILFSAPIAGFAQKGATVKFMSSEADLPADQVAKFNKENPDGITIVRTELDYTKFVAEAMAGNASDLINLGQGSDVAYYAPRGLLLPISKYLKSSKVLKMSDIDMLGNANYQFDVKSMQFGKGDWYGLTKDYNNVTAITYNKEMFKAAGIPYLSETVPITYAELYDIAKKLTKKDASGKILVWGTEPAFWLYGASDMANAQKLSVYADKDRTKMNNDPKVRDIWKYWARFAVEDLAPNVKNPAPGWAGSDFQSDRVALVQLGYWFGAQMHSSPGYNEKYGWAPTPILAKGSPRVTNTLGATGIVFYAKTKVPDAAFKVFEWYIGGGYGEVRAKTGWGIPALKSLAALLPEADKFDKSRKMIALDDAKYFQPWQTCPWIPAGVWANAWAGPLEKYTRGEINADQFVDQFYANMNKAIADGRSELGL